MNSFKFSNKAVFVSFILMLQLSVSGQSLQGRRPTEFPDLPQITDSTLLFTQDSVSRESYKFRADNFKQYLFSGGMCLDSMFRNLNNNCIVPFVQTKTGGTVFYGNIFNQLLNDTSGQYYFCNAITSFPGFSAQVSGVDSSFFTVDTTFQLCSSTMGDGTNGYEYSQSIPVNIQLCPGDIIDKIIVRIHLNQFTTYNYSGGAALTLSVNGVLSTPSNRVEFDQNSPEEMKLVGTYGGGYYSCYEFIDDFDRSSVNNVTASFLWTNNNSFQLDGMEVIYYVKKSHVVLSTDSNGCIVLDTIHIPESEPFNLQASNGLTASNSDLIKLGGTLSENTHISGNGYEMVFNNLSGFYLNSNQNVNLSAQDINMNATQSVTIQSQNHVNISSNNNAINISNAYGNNNEGVSVLSGGPIDISNAIGGNTQGISLLSSGDITLANNYGNSGYLIINPGKDDGYAPAYFLSKDTAGNSNWRDLSLLGTVGSAVYVQNGLSGNGSVITPVELGGTLFKKYYY
ncbi:MAG: hypothetical protein IPM95_06785 [Sphingobacteriales bacterium]|nr:hypothetical protein [Sphingobacteriales bacterium]